MDNTLVSKEQGIYIHIPFCDSICPYCDFAVFKTSHQDLFETLVFAICQELSFKQHFFAKDTPLSSIYFGGGTPSLLSAVFLKRILVCIQQYFTFSNKIEITIEANPKHLHLQTIENYLEIGINRFSIGIQSFQDSELHFLGRKHGADDVEKLVYKILPSFPSLNWSLDLIFGLNDQTLAHLEQNLDCAAASSAKHISLYALTIEEHSIFGKREKKGFTFSASSDFQADCMEYAQGYLESRNFLQYEVSNYSKKDYHSRHNSLYWHGGQFLGLGPGAWSFWTDSLFQKGCRSGNPRHVKKYVSWIDAQQKNTLSNKQQGCNPFELFEKEDVSRWQMFLERIYLGLRTSKGISLDITHNTQWIQQMLPILQMFCQQGILQEFPDRHFAPTDKGFLFADVIAKKMLGFWDQSP